MKVTLRKLKGEIMDEFIRAKWHLENWATFMHTGEVTRGYPRKSLGMATHEGRVHTFEDLENEVDGYSARLANRIIEDMDKRLSCALHNMFLACVFRFRGNPPYDEALADFWARAEKAGLV